MARSSPQPEDPIRSSGLRPGTACWLEFELENSPRTASTIVDDISELRLTLLAPMEKMRPIEIPESTPIVAYFAGANGTHFKFVSASQGTSKDGRLLYLRRPTRVGAGERRKSFRLEIVLRPTDLFKIVVDAAGEPPDKLARLSTVVDISEGGLCLSTRMTVAVGERLGVKLDFPGGGAVNTRMIVRSVETPPSGLRNHRVHCEFLNLDPAMRDHITKFVLRRQRELRLRGQL